MAIADIHKPMICSRKKKFSVKEKGFSLLEMAIVITISAVSISAGLVVFNEYSRQTKYDQTIAKIEEIMDAIDDYADRFNRLPCPADATDLISDANFGIGTYSGSCTTENLENTGTPDTVMGMLPVSTLNLYPSYAYDAWGNRFSYVIDQDSAQTNGMDEAEADIELDLKNFDSSSSYSGVVVIVMSHGENGYGAWPARGGSTRNNITGGITQEDANAEITTTNYFHASVSVAGYDDILYFWTKDQIDNDEME